MLAGALVFQGPAARPALPRRLAPRDPKPRRNSPEQLVKASGASLFVGLLKKWNMKEKKHHVFLKLYVLFLHFLPIFIKHHLLIYLGWTKLQLLRLGPTGVPRSHGAHAESPADRGQVLGDAEPAESTERWRIATGSEVRRGGMKRVEHGGTKKMNQKNEPKWMIHWFWLALKFRRMMFDFDVRP